MRVFSYPLYALCVDPGGTTGLALMEFTEDSVRIMERWYYGNEDDVWMVIRAKLDEFRSAGRHIVLVVEQFDKRPGIVNPDYSPMFINKDIAHNIEGDYEVFWQIPAAAKNLVRPPGKKNRGPDHLKRFDWYLSGKGNNHTNDAVRHGIVFAVETLHHMATIEKGWPKPKDID